VGARLARNHPVLDGDRLRALTPEQDHLLDLARRYTEAWCSQNPARVAEHYAPEGSLTINGGKPSVGRAVITEAAQSFMSAFPDMQVLMDDLVLRDEGIEYRWTLIGTNTGAGGSGKRVRISGFEKWTIGDDGLIAASFGHYDQSEYDRQLEHGVEEPV
jgi:predicted ester cyclase